MASLSNLSRPVVVMVRPVAHCIMASCRASHLFRKLHTSAWPCEAWLSRQSDSNRQTCQVFPSRPYRLNAAVQGDVRMSGRLHLCAVYAAASLSAYRHTPHAEWTPFRSASAAAALEFSWMGSEQSTTGRHADLSADTYYSADTNSE
jgi:hypothetical protein